MLNDLRIIQKDDLGDPRRQGRSRGDLVFTDYDLVPLKNKIKIYKDFSNCPYKFKFIIYVDYKTDFTEKHKFIRENFSDKINSNEIAICYTSNFTTKYNYIPMTSWILAHRIVHGLQMQIKPQEDKLFNRINGIIPAFSSEKEFNNGSLSACEQILFPVNILFTMRSARFASIHNTLDVFAEALAQYIICGFVKFNRIENWDMKRFDLLSNWFDKKFTFYRQYDGMLITKSPISILCEKAILWINSLSSEEKHKVNELIEKCEKETNQSCKEILDSQLGK